MSDPRVVETFSIFDADNSGSITTDELREVHPTPKPELEPEPEPGGKFVKFSLSPGVLSPLLSWTSHHGDEVLPPNPNPNSNPNPNLTLTRTRTLTLTRSSPPSSSA